MVPETLSSDRLLKRPWPVLGRKVAAMLIRRKRGKVPISEGGKVVQRPLLWTASYLLASTLSGPSEPWGAAAITFGLSCFGFLASRLPRFCPLDIGASFPLSAQPQGEASGADLADARA